ncbi:GGDEF domain-containing protein [Mycolicibacterium thermoresistibile]
MLKALRRSWRRPDHYYWFTSFLAARRARTSTCRFIASIVLVLGSMPAVLLLSSAGPQTLPGQLTAVGATVSSLVIAFMWLRDCWPSRTESRVLVSAAAVVIAVFALTLSDPSAGLVWSTAFAVLAGYVALFHCARYATYAVLLTAVTTGLLAIQLAQTAGVAAAVCGFVFVTMVTFAVASACNLLVGLLDVDVLDADIEPLTGLLNRDAFYRSAGHLISRSRDDDRQLVIALINIDNLRLLRDAQGPAAADRARVAIGQTLRENTRHNAFVAHLGHEEFLIADTFSSTDSFPLVERVRGAISTTPPRLTASIGVVSTPLRGLAVCPPEALLDELIAVAGATMYEARRAGGNQARYRKYPKPTAVTEAHTLEPGDSDL